MGKINILSMILVIFFTCINMFCSLLHFQGRTEFQEKKKIKSFISFLRMLMYRIYFFIFIFFLFFPLIFLSLLNKNIKPDSWILTLWLGCVSLGPLLVLIFYKRKQVKKN